MLSLETFMGGHDSGRAAERGGSRRMFKVADSVSALSVRPQRALRIVSFLYSQSGTDKDTQGKKSAGLIIVISPVLSPSVSGLWLSGKSLLSDDNLP